MLEIHDPDGGDGVANPYPHHPHPHPRRAQPRPKDTQVLYIPELRKTVIARTWHPGAPALCRRCPAGRCIARSTDHCLFLVPGNVGHAEGEDYSTHGLRWPEPDPAGGRQPGVRRVRGVR